VYISMRMNIRGVGGGGGGGHVYILYVSHIGIVQDVQKLTVIKYHTYI
jgi:hypothetical protein